MGDAPALSGIMQRLERKVIDEHIRAAKHRLVLAEARLSKRYVAVQADGRI